MGDLHEPVHTGAGPANEVHARTVATRSGQTIGRMLFSLSRDFDGNGLVDGQDLGLLFVSWGEYAGVLPCADLNIDGVISGADFGLMMLAWGSCPVDPCIGIECDDQDECTVDYCVDGECVHARFDICGGVCGSDSAGNCDEANGSPGCNDADCCTQICEIDPYCCVVVWDTTCRNKALSGEYPGCND